MAAILAVVVFVVYGEPVPAAVSRMALHMVPFGWVLERRPTKKKKMPLLNLEWSWKDAVTFAGTESARMRKKTEAENDPLDFSV